MLERHLPLPWGRLILYPSETQYALGCHPLDRAALRLLDAAKGRSGKPYLMLIPDLAALPRFVKLDARLAAEVAKLTEQHWPGPLTLVLPAQPWLPVELTAGSGTVGVRVSSDPVAASIARAWGGVVSTSANRSGQPPAEQGEEAARQWGELVDLAWIDTPRHAPPSTVAAWRGTGWQVLRQGAVQVQDDADQN
ncbi:MAG: threonylcarbamoyl-AMP synthase [Alphaproteobacteria bacterium CG_4_10_14_0_2_um_filter_63_37]|nr:MAG: hypothetical protein AUJ55_01285 [Proteobacteria bacterium CG1_02_64_396]PJA26003.1 MAG: threonylcarbamoyl-AMP synthase [Alphaproteobacteria bacterium CG_4_10_14_0_2_um_filter_63_37]